MKNKESQNKELKTLKDFEECNEVGNEFVWSNDLKKEAVKWIKEREFLPVPKGVEPKIHHAYMHGEIEFIKHFFNLTEKDLEEIKNE